MSKNSKDRIVELNKLIDLSVDTATGILRHLGSLTPAYLGVGLDGPFTLLELAEEKDVFADIIRLECVARRAFMGVFIAETWGTVVELDKLSSAVRPSEAEDRCEHVMLSGEVAGGGQAILRLLPILRDAQGRFAGLGKSEPSSGQPLGGRFSGLLPRSRPSEYERVSALNALAAKRAASARN